MNANQLVRLIPMLLRSSRGKNSRWVILLIVCIAAYAFLQPMANRQFGWSLPGVGGSGNQVDTDPPGEGGESFPQVDIEIQASGQLKEIGRDRYESTAGLVYTSGSQHGHRLKHVMYHTQDVPDRAGQHGVFDANDQDSVVKLLDEAYLMAKSGKNTQKQQEQDRTVYTVNMGRRIGYVGGQSGNRKNHPETRHIRMVLEGQRVITAFPVTE